MDKHVHSDFLLIGYHMVQSAPNTFDGISTAGAFSLNRGSHWLERRVSPLCIHHCLRVPAFPMKVIEINAQGSIAIF